MATGRPGCRNQFCLVCFAKKNVFRRFFLWILHCILADILLTAMLFFCIKDRPTAGQSTDHASPDAVQPVPGVVLFRVLHGAAARGRTVLVRATGRLRAGARRS